MPVQRGTTQLSERRMHIMPTRAVFVFDAKEHIDTTAAHAHVGVDERRGRMAAGERTREQRRERRSARSATSR